MLRLMIVDDEQIIREALSEMIDYTSIGYELIATTKNGMEAYDVICDEYPDVVITDIRMPILNGLDLIERSMKSDSKITFILLSGYSEFEYGKQAMKYGVRYYLLKPTDKQELIDSLVSIRHELTLKEARRQEEQEHLLRDLQAPLEQSFIMEALERPEEFSSIYGKYQSLLSIRLHLFLRRRVLFKDLPERCRENLPGSRFSSGISCYLCKEQCHTDPPCKHTRLPGGNSAGPDHFIVHWSVRIL